MPHLIKKTGMEVLGMKPVLSDATQIGDKTWAELKGLAMQVGYEYPSGSDK